MRKDVPGSCFVEYRPIPGCSLYLLGSDHTVWTSSVPEGFGPRGWRLRKLTRYKGTGAACVHLRRDDGTGFTISLNRLMREVFPPVDEDEPDLPGPSAQFGRDNGRAKLTREQAEELRRLKKAGWTTAELAERYGISKNNVYAVFNGKTWSGPAPDLPDPAPLDVVPPPAAAPAPAKRRKGRTPRYGALRPRAEDAIPLESLALEMPRAGAPFERKPLDPAEARRLHAEGWSVKALVARYGVRPHVIAALLKGAATPAADAAR
jgi:plasmid maintenance system antidote protein VapI